MLATDITNGLGWVGLVEDFNETVLQENPFKWIAAEDLEAHPNISAGTLFRGAGHHRKLVSFLFDPALCEVF